MHQRPNYHKPLESNSRTEVRATQLRKNLSLPESLLWRELKSKNLGGFRFRRQHPLGPWIADFYCHEICLVIEIDGSTHQDERFQTDQARDRWMNDRGVQVVRVTAKDVLKSMPAVLRLILDRAEQIRAESGRSIPPPPAAPAPPPSVTGEDPVCPPPSPTGEVAREA